ncbi:hypothetical protein A3Q56_03618 [Intoshia linei]|uniref:UBC core domain-containing protein n=1 Tax=Intoshia linei TaxID=1819745 RepID=A0A177B2V6_9BILA|nr:hypothetical protein A3Q56_03618 [Intoshia linei]
MDVISKSAAHNRIQAQYRTAIKSLQSELEDLMNNPIEGFRVSLLNDANIFEWLVIIFGPPDTLYAGGYFKAKMKFPKDYPFGPPSLTFINSIWHPNIYKTGEVCISILHAPLHDPRSGELPSEVWKPIHTVSTVLISIISLLSEPNTSSPANVEASLMYRRYLTKSDKDEYLTVIKKNIRDSKIEAKKDGISIPTTLKEYLASKSPEKIEKPKKTVCDFYDDDYFDFDNTTLELYEEDEDNVKVIDDPVDSGTEMC